MNRVLHGYDEHREGHGPITPMTFLPDDAARPRSAGTRATRLSPSRGADLKTKAIQPLEGAADWAEALKRGLTNLFELSAVLNASFARAQPSGFG